MKTVILDWRLVKCFVFMTKQIFNEYRLPRHIFLLLLPLLLERKSARLVLDNADYTYLRLPISHNVVIWLNLSLLAQCEVCFLSSSKSSFYIDHYQGQNIYWLKPFGMHFRNYVLCLYCTSINEHLVQHYVLTISSQKQKLMIHSNLD